MSNLTRFSPSAAWLGVLLCLTTLATAQQALKAGYFTGANTPGVPDSRVVISNPDVYGGGNGDLCAMIYVFDPSQEMVECCGCLVSLDGERELSVNIDLASNPVNGVFPHRGSVRIVSNPPNSSTAICNPAMLDNPQPELLAWGTHPSKFVLNLNNLTETEYQDVPLSDREANRLPAICYFLGITIPGRGVCTCGTGD